jgi:uncharacterized protein (TIGR02300 family)
LADPALGAKQICPNCQAKFYDLSKRPAHCPKCGTDFDPEEAVKFRRIRARSVTPDYEADEEAEDQVKAKAAEADEDEEEEVTAPEIDQPGEDGVLVPDEDGEVEGAEPEAPPVTEIDIDEDVELEEEDDSVPFIEEDEDEDGFEEDIEGLPGEGEEDR